MQNAGVILKTTKWTTGLFSRSTKKKKLCLHLAICQVYKKIKCVFAVMGPKLNSSEEQMSYKQGQSVPTRSKLL